jgi:photosystem II stability/assembly factor-like uncharacterized protein
MSDSIFSKYFLNSAGEPVPNLTVKLVPQANVGFVGSITLIEDQSRPGYYYTTSAPTGEYRLYVNNVQYEQHIWHGDDKLTKVASYFDTDNNAIIINNVNLLNYSSSGYTNVVSKNGFLYNTSTEKYLVPPTNIPLTYLSASQAISSGSLQTDLTYFITDRNVYLTANSTSSFSDFGYYLYQHGQKSWAAQKLTGSKFDNCTVYQSGSNANVNSVYVGTASLFSGSVASVFSTPYYINNKRWIEYFHDDYKINYVPDNSTIATIEAIANNINKHQSNFTSYAVNDHIVLQSSTEGTLHNGSLTHVTKTSASLCTNPTFTSSATTITRMNHGTSVPNFGRLFECKYNFTLDNLYSLYDPLYDNMVEQDFNFQNTPSNIPIRYKSYTHSETKYTFEGDVRNYFRVNEITRAHNFKPDIYRKVVISNIVYFNGETLITVNEDATLALGGTDDVTNGGELLTLNPNGNTILNFNWDNTNVTNNKIVNAVVKTNFIDSQSYIKNNNIFGGIFGNNILFSKSNIEKLNTIDANIQNNIFQVGSGLYNLTISGGNKRSHNYVNSIISNNNFISYSKLSNLSLTNGEWIIYNTFYNTSYTNSNLNGNTNILNNVFVYTKLDKFDMSDRSTIVNNDINHCIFYNTSLSYDSFISTNLFNKTTFLNNKTSHCFIIDNIIHYLLWKNDNSDDIKWRDLQTYGAGLGLYEGGCGQLLSTFQKKSQGLTIGTSIQFNSRLNPIVGSISFDYKMNDVYMYDTSIYACGNTGSIILTENTGTSWTTQSGISTANFNSLAVLGGDSKIYVVGDSNTIMTSTDHTNWNNVGIPDVNSYPSKLNKIKFINKGTGFIVGDGVIYKTINTGSTWIAKSWPYQIVNYNPRPPFKELKSVYFLNDNVGWACGVEGIIVKTIDGGETWTSQTSGTTKTINDIVFYDSSHGVAICNDGMVLTTSYGGNNWSSQTLTPVSNLTSLSRNVDGFYIITGDNGNVYVSEDGISWTSYIASIFSLYGVYTSITDASVAVAVGDHGTVLINTDGGVNWSSLFSKPNEIIIAQIRNKCAIDTVIIAKDSDIPENLTGYPTISIGTSDDDQLYLQTQLYSNLSDTIINIPWVFNDDCKTIKIKIDGGTINSGGLLVTLKGIYK